MKILVVAAHPDDEVLGCGATLARLSGAGNAVCTAILGEGATSRGTGHEETVAALKEQSRRAAAFLGYDDVRHMGFPDNRFDTVPLLDVVKSVESLIADVAPDVVFTHHGGDLNVDHAVTFKAVLTATRPMQGCGVRSIYAFETPSATEWAFGCPSPFQPDVFVDVTRQMKAKLDAMSCYESELREYPHPRSLEALAARAKHWGSVSGLEAAEPLRLVRRVVCAKEETWTL